MLAVKVWPPSDEQPGSSRGREIQTDNPSGHEKKPMDADRFRRTETNSTRCAHNNRFWWVSSFYRKGQTRMHENFERRDITWLRSELSRRRHPSITVANMPTSFPTRALQVGTPKFCDRDFAWEIWGCGEFPCKMPIWGLLGNSFWEHPLWFWGKRLLGETRRAKVEVLGRGEPLTLDHLCSWSIAKFSSFFLLRSSCWSVFVHMRTHHA